LNELYGGTPVFLDGCPACANMSLNIQKAPDRLPVPAFTLTGFKAASMREEVRRPTGLLNRKG